MSVHPSSVVDPGAELGRDVEIGPFCVVGPDVAIGDGSRLHSHVAVSGPTRLGERTEAFPFASLGQAPQDLKFAGERTELVVGNGNIFRESVTVHRGTEGGGGLTRIGDDNLFMAYTHIAHDCLVGDRNIFANAATLAGHVEVGDDATIGAYSGVHQFCRVGNHAFVGGYSVIVKDALPYFRSVGNHARVYGVNTIGLERKGFTPEAIKAIKAAFRLLFQSKLNTQAALERIRAELAEVPEVAYLADFIGSSQRGVIKR